MLAAGGAVLLVAGCASTHDKGPYLPQTPKTFRRMKPGNRWSCWIPASNTR